MSTCNPLRLWKAEAVESFDFRQMKITIIGGAGGEVTGSVYYKLIYET